MTEVFTENILAWACVAVAALVVGAAVAKGTNRRSAFVAGACVACVALVAGILCVRFVQTDAKRVKSVVAEIASAVAKNDADAVCANISDSAPNLEMLAKATLKLADVERTKVSNLQILEINRATSPPRAKVALRASASGKSRGIEYPFTVVVDFPEIEFRLEPDGKWRVVAFQYRPFGRGEERFDAR